MSFGQRNKTSNRFRHRPISSNTEDDSAELLTWSEKNPGKFQGVIVLGSFVLVAVILLAAAPHTYAAQKVIYHNSTLATGALSGGQKKEFREKAESKLGVDFRKILTPKSDETTPAMQRVAGSCLPKRKFENFVMPTAALHTAYVAATDYLICAMKTEPTRFCQKHERHRLVEQLNQYAERRQNVLAYERVIAKMSKSKQAKYYKKHYKEELENLIGGKSLPAMQGRIGADVDPRIITEMRQLIRNGYLSSRDFGWLGLYLPEEYAPVLGEGAVLNSCA